MGGERHMLEEGGSGGNDNAMPVAPLDSGADGGPMDDASLGRVPPPASGSPTAPGSSGPA